MSGRCKDCRFYQYPHWDKKSSNFGSCARWHVGYHVEPEDVKANEAWVENDEGWGMMLGPDFGCVLFDSKP
jgi:hypothetical protein